MKVWNVQSLCFVILLLHCTWDVKAQTTNCATFYSSTNNAFSISDGEKRAGIVSSGQYFWPQKARVSEQCSVRIYDTYGNSLVIDKDQDSLGWFSQTPIDAACCECGGCAAAATNGLQGHCARLYENERCDSCSGLRLSVKDGDEVRNLGPTAGKMSSVAVARGCILNVYWEYNFQGWRYNFTESTNKFGDNWHKGIKSLRCGCNGLTTPEITLPTVRTTRPPYTFPTVPTTRPSYTFPTVPSTKPPKTLPTVPTTRPPMTFPTVPTTRPPMTFPTVPTTRPPMTLPTVPTTRPPMTLPTVPTTRPPMTLPTETTTTKPPYTVPTVTTTTTTPRPIITLPTVPPEDDNSNGEYSNEDDFNWDSMNNLGGAKEELVAVEPDSTPAPSESSSSWGFNDDTSEEEIAEEEKKEDATEETDGDDEWDW